MLTAEIGQTEGRCRDECRRTHHCHDVGVIDHPSRSGDAEYPESSVGKGDIDNSGVLTAMVRRVSSDPSQRGPEHQGLGQEQPHSVPQADEEQGNWRQGVGKPSSTHPTR